MLLFMLMAVVFSVAFSATESTTAYAAEESEYYDMTDVMRDLSYFTIAGKKFDVSDYPENDKGNLQVIMLLEYGFDREVATMSDFSLYVYVYDPQKLAVDTESDRNKIEMRFGGNEHFGKYDLRFLSGTDLFYKFKVVFSSLEGQEIYNHSLSVLVRRYEIGGIELDTGGTNATDFSVGVKYEYSGMGATLQCSATIDEVVLSLDVHATTYRPNSSNGKENTKDQMSSVYFNIPNDYIEKYGEMKSLRATWLQALTKPILVMGKKEVYDAILPYVGKEIPDVEEDDYKTIPYGVAAIGSYVPSMTIENADGTYSSSSTVYHFDYSYNMPSGGFWSPVFQTNLSDTKNEITKLYYLFGTETFADDSADSYDVSASALETYMSEYSEGKSNLIGGTSFSKDLFEERESDPNFNGWVVVDSDDISLSLTTSTLNGFWQQLFGKKYTTSTLGNIPAIQKVTSCTSAEQAEKDYYINQADYAEFRSAYEEENCTTYVFHFAVDDYFSEEANIFTHSMFGLTIGSSNAYFAQEYVYLGFDIIDVTMQKGEEITVLPVVASPVNVIGEVEHPVETHSDITAEEAFDWRKALRIVLAVVAGLFFLIFILPIVRLVVRLIGRIIGAIRGRRS